MKKLSLQTFIAYANGYCNPAKNMKTLLLAFLFCITGHLGFAAVSVTAGVLPAPGSICPTLAVGGGATAYTALGAITITEGAASDFSAGSNVITIAPPTGWQFNTGVVPTFGWTLGRDITGISGSYSGGNLTITITCSGAALMDQLTISNLQVEATSTAAGSGNIYASSAFVAGITTGSSGTNFGTLSLTAGITPSVSIAVSPAGTVCAGTKLTFTATPTNGGSTPSYNWFVNGSSVGIGGNTYSTSTLNNGDIVNCVLTPGGVAGCVFPLTATSGNITASISAIPAAVSVSGGGTFCGSSTITASGGAGGTIYYEGITSNGVSIVTPSSSQVIAASGTYYFRSYNGTCWGVQGSAAVTINAVPAATIVSGGSTTCGGTQTITASGGGGGVVYFQGTTSGGTSVATPSLSQVIAASGTYYFRSYNGTCWGTEGSTTVTINAPATDNAGVAQTVCQGNTITLAGTIGGSAATSTWTAPSGTFSNASSLTSTYTPTIATGSVTLTLTTNDPDGAGPCPAAVSTVVITVNQAPIVGAGAPQTLCAGGTITLAGTTGGSTTSTTWSAPSGSFSNAALLNSTYTPTISSGSITLTLTSNAFGVCPAGTSTVLITVNQAATANAGAAQIVCQGGTVTLAGVIGGSATSSTWSAPSGSFSDVTSLTSTYTPSIGAGPVTLTLTTNDPDGAGPCAVATSTIVITVNAAATANAGIPQTVCAGSTITLAGARGGSAISSTWTAPSGTFGNAAIVNSTYTPTIASGAITLTLTTNDPDGAGPCAAAVSTVVITVNPTPTPVTVFPVSGSVFCGSQTLSAFGGLGGTIYYQGLTSGGTSIATPSSSQLVNVSGTYYFRALAGTCWSVEGNSAITINPAPTDNAGVPQTLCAGGTITLAGSIGGSASSSTWSAPSGSFSNASSLVSTYTPTITGGTVTLTLTTNDPDGAGPCGTAVSTVVITVNATPTANAGVAQSVCAGGTITLAGSIGGSATGSIWSAPSGTFSDVTSLSSTYTPSILTGPVTLKLTTTGGLCPSVNNTVIITVNPLPTQFTVTGGGSYCSGGAGLPVGISNSNAGISYQLVRSFTNTGAPILGTGAAFNFPNQTVPDFYTIVATNTVTSCVNTMIGGVAISTLPLPNVYNLTVANGGNYCAGTAGVDFTLSASDAGINYQLWSGGLTVSPTISGTGSLLNLGTYSVVGTYTAVATDVVNGCTNNMNNTPTVTMNPLPIAFLVAGGGHYCSGGTGVHVILAGSIFGTSYQLFNGAAMVGAPMAGNGGPLDFGLQTGAGTYTVVATITATGCTNNMTGSATIIIDPLPTVYAMTGGGGYCAGGGGSDVGLNGSDVGTSYQLFLGGGPVGVPKAGTGSALDFGFKTVVGTYTIAATTGLGCTTNMSGTSVVSINPLPVVQTISAGGSYCSGGSGVDLTLSASELGVDYQLWTGGLPIGGPVHGTGVGTLDLGFQTTGGAYTVVATNTTTGCTNNMAGIATITIDPLPTVYTVSAGGSYCSGAAGIDIQLSNSNALINYELWFNGLPTGTILPGITGSFLDFGFQTAAGTYTIIATNTATFCSSIMSGSSVISVNPLPLVYTVSGGGSYCAGGAGVLVNLSGSDAGINYQTFITGAGAGTVAGTGTALSNLETIAGIYTMVATDAITSCSVTMTGSATITVNPLPAAITGVTNVCIGSTTVLSDATSGGAWSSSNTAIATINPVTGSVTPVTAGIYSISYTLPLTGCMIASTDTITALPVVSGISAPSALCSGYTVAFSDATAGGVWSSSNAVVAGVDLAGNVTGGVAGTATISYTVTNSAGCVTNATSPLTILVSPVVAPVTGAITNVCTGYTITLSDITAGGAWSSSNTAIATVNSSGIMTGVAFGSADISYTVTNILGCKTSSLYGVSIGGAMPPLAVVPSSATICHGNPVNLALVTTGTGLTYQWSVGGTDIPGATNDTYVTSSTGLFAVVVDNGTCQVAMPSINVVLPPVPVISYDSVANVLYTGSFASYQWFLNSLAIPGATSYSIPKTANGDFTVAVTDGNGCTDTSTIFTVTNVIVNNVKTVTNAGDIRIYPNPVASVIYIDAPEKVFVTVMSMDGKMLLAQKEAVSINVSQLPVGVYLIMIYDENNMLMKADKFVKIQ